jgi:site-specific recombinase XerD
MAITDAIIHYRRFLKRKNYSLHTVKNYMHTLRQFVLWVNIPIEHVSGKQIFDYIDHLRAKRLQPKTINCHLDRASADFTII